MPIEIKQGSIEEKILKAIKDRYPITVKEVQKELGLQEKKVEMGLRSLQKKGIIQLEPLPDKTYIRQIRGDVFFLGRNPTQRRRYKHKGGKKRKKKEEEDVGYV